MAEETTETVEEAVETTQPEQSNDIEKMKAALEKANKEAASFRHKLAEIEKAKEAEMVKKSEDLSELKSLLEQKEAKLSELEQLATTYQERDQKRFEALVAQVPEGLRDTLDDSIPLAKRIELAEKLAAQKPNAPSTRQPGEPQGTSITRAAFEAKSPAERQAFIKEGGKITD